MPKSIHFICRQGKNLSVESKSEQLYCSGVWDLSVGDAELVVGGMLLLHETKAERFYFGGVIVEFRPVRTEHAHPMRIQFVVKADERGKGVRWPSGSHARAWTTGPIEALRSIVAESAPRLSAAGTGSAAAATRRSGGSIPR